MKLIANFGTLLEGLDIPQKYQYLSKLGFKLVEIPNPYDLDAETHVELGKKFNLKHVLINAPMGTNKGILINGSSEEIDESITKAVKYAKILGVKKVHVMAGITGNRSETMIRSDDADEAVYVNNLALANNILAKNGIQCLIEPINKYTIPGYFLNSYCQAIRIIEKIGSDNIKILYDLFHAQQIQGQLIEFAKKNANLIGHLQGAQVSDRGPFINSGEIDFKYVIPALERINKEWMIGAECVLNFDDQTLRNELFNWFENGSSDVIPSFMEKWLQHCQLQF
uniref:Putative hydroxypyruvate isomerase n=1 Tax=Rhabditophanes sp. KR3021 TaxID=114890 RepID=A0AC35TSU1_9BILA